MHYQNRRTWAQDSLTTLAPRLLDGSTVGVVGLGAIGCEVARLASTLGARVEGIRRRSDAPTPQGVSAVDTPDALARRLPSWDVLVARSASDTCHVRSGRPTRACAHEAGRNPRQRGQRQLGREPDLIDALTRGSLGGAALDVFDEEPLAPSSPLWTLPNVLITPHVAGVRADYWTAATNVFIENLRRYRAGQPLINLVDPSLGY